MLNRGFQVIFFLLVMIIFPNNMLVKPISGKKISLTPEKYRKIGGK